MMQNKFKQYKYMTLLFALLFLVATSCTARAKTQQTPSITQTPQAPESRAMPAPLPRQRDVPPTPSREPEPEPEPEPERIPIEARPVWMYIPTISVDAEIQGTETDYANNTMDIVHSGSIISWWMESAVPGNDGNAIFASHNIWSGRNGQLHYLDTLEIGDEMEILYDDGSSRIFKLESVFVYLLATAPAEIIMDVRGDARVTLITCKAPFNYVTGTSDNRIVAIFKLEDDFIIPDPPIEPFPPRSQ